MPSDKDKRRYKRYKHELQCYLSFKENFFNAKIIDYSIKGISFIIDGIPPIDLGSDVHFRIEDLNIEDDGKLVWVQKFDSYMKGGIEKKSISGLLKHYPLADILIDLQRSEKNGILDLRNDPVIKKIYIKSGDMVFATSNRAEDHFVEFLLKTGKITIDQYYQLIDTSEKKGKSHGAVLVELGYLKPKDLIWAVRHHVEEIILSLFQWEEGIFSFIEGPVLSDKVIQLKLSVANLIYRGIKRINDPTYFNNAMPPMDALLSYSSDPMDLFQDVNLDTTDKDILFLANGKRTIKEIISVSPLNHFQTIKTLCALFRTRIIDLKENYVAEDEIHEDILKEPELETDHAFLEKVEDVHKKLGSTDYYSILGIEKWATLDTIKKAYYKAAKEFHPDKHLHLPSDTLKSKLNAIFSRLTEIYKILSDSNKRIEYDNRPAVKPANLQTDNVEMAKTLFQEGKDAFRKGSHEKAKELFGRAIYLDSLVSSYYFYLGLVLEKQQKLHEAGKILNKALKLDPFNSDYLAELGHIYLQLGFNLRAKSTFQKAIRSDSSNKRAIEGMKKIQAAG